MLEKLETFLKQYGWEYKLDADGNSLRDLQIVMDMDIQSLYPRKMK